MKIGFAGAHRTGKTTLAKKVAQELKLAYEAGSATPVFEQMGVNPTDDLSMNMRFHIQMGILDQFKALSADGEKLEFVTDRTPLDYIAYTVSELNTREYRELGDMGKASIRAYIRECLDQLHNLDVVFIVPPAIDIIYDSSKALCDRVIIDNIHALIMEYADQSEHPQIYVLDRSMVDLEDRAHYAKGVIQTLLSSKEISYFD
ncbi:hypothetical protein JCM19235_1305 [Vibrio maritimus]|uniref:NadR/Ttd14 AAA domain-containing protein n=1 Tax=Vibrio maritimus TaxID=990268 RepID=A0A090S936_9VIBR|nr:hypothetical protein JCM19235_1305 [Vibrio maritimus]